MTSKYYPSTKKDADADIVRNQKIARLHEQGVDRGAISERFSISRSRVAEIIRKATP